MLEAKAFIKFLEDSFESFEGNGNEIESRQFKLPFEIDFEVFDDLKVFPKIFWSSKHHDDFYFSFGNIENNFATPGELRSLNPSLSFFFYQSFDQQPPDQTWEGFKNHELIIPLFLIKKSKEGFTLTINKKKSDKLKLNYLPTERQEDISIKNLKSEDNWSKAFKSAHQELISNRLNKIVIATKTTGSLSNSPTLANLLNTFYQSKNNYFFSLSLSEDKTFLCATPETLVLRKKDNYSIDVLAGTQKGLADSDALLESSKDILEHQFVKDQINETLLRLNIEPQYAFENQILELKNLIHLHSQIVFTSKESIIDSLLESLHPTPAVGGTPKKLALSKIQEIEDFPRGIYASPFGFFTEDSDDISVALRSLVLTGKKIEAFAGCGLVKESQELAEWDEIQNKFKSFLGAKA